MLSFRDRDSFHKNAIVYSEICSVQGGGGVQAPYRQALLKGTVRHDIVTIVLTLVNNKAFVLWTQSAPFQLTWFGAELYEVTVIFGLKFSKQG